MSVSSIEWVSKHVKLFKCVGIVINENISLVLTQSVLLAFFPYPREVTMEIELKKCNLRLSRSP